MAWRRPGDKPLSEPMMVSLPTHICVTRPQWVNTVFVTYTFICFSSTLPYTRKTHLPSYPGHFREPIESQWAPWDIKGSATFMIMVIYRSITGLIHYTHNSDVFTMELLHWLLKSDVTYAWWRHQMETFSALLAICAGNSPVPGEFPSQRPVTRTFDVHFDLRLNKRLSKQWWGWWFETLSSPLWRNSNGASVVLGLLWSSQWLAVCLVLSHFLYQDRLFWSVSIEQISFWCE